MARRIARALAALLKCTGIGSAPQGAGGMSALNLSLVMGPDFQQMASNLSRNLNEGRVRLMQVIVQKD